MASSQMSKVIQYVHHIALRDKAEPTDGELLESFVRQKGDAALAALVRRHGSMVWGVCRRLLRHYQDAEDAFQATFLVLVRKATTIRDAEMVGNWLYGVAHQTAVRLRTTAAKRGIRERQVAEMPEPIVIEEDPWNDLQPILDQALKRLPDKYRILVVLCDLEGKTRKEVARQLGCPEGTVAGRLARARAMLAKRLVRQGLTISGGMLAVVLSAQAASTSMPAPLASSTIRAATLLASGGKAATTVGLISAKVAALTEGVVKAMFLTKLKLGMGVLLAVSTCWGVGVLAYTERGRAE